MYIRNMQNRKGFSLQFCDKEELNVFLEFIESYPDSEGGMKRLAERLRSGISDKYANDVTKYSIPLWFEDIPDVISSLWIAYTAWDSSDFGQRAEKAVEHDDKLYEIRSKKVEEHDREMDDQFMSMLTDDLNFTDSNKEAN